MQQFYSYVWLRKDGTPRYVGKGSGRRAFTSDKGHRPPKDKSLILIFPAATEAEAMASEIVMIDLFGRKDVGTGCLRNFTDGGEGAAGHRPTEATKRKISLAGRGVPHPTWRGQKHSPATRAKMSAAHTGHPSPTLGRKFSAESRAKMSKPKSPEQCAKISAARKAYWARRRENAA